MTRHDRADLIAARAEDGVLTLTLGAAPAHTLSLAMIRALRAALDAAAADDAVRAIVLHGPGRIFCAGHDLKEIARHRADPDRGRAFLDTLFGECGAVMQAVSLGPKPVIAAVEGIATAGGLQLVAACDIAIAGPEARVCLPGASNGGFCTTPAVAVGRSIARKHLMELALASEPFDADWAYRTGLFNRIVPAGAVLAEAQAFARGVARHHAPAIAAGRQATQAQLDLPLAEAYALATPVMVAHFMDPARIAIDLDRWSE